MFHPEDDFPHSVPMEAFMTWKENWVFPSLDTKGRVASVFHFSLRPGQGEGVFSAKFSIDGDEHRYVKVGKIPRDLTSLRSVSDERVSFSVVDPGKKFAITYRSPEMDADMSYTGRFPPFDFSDGPKPDGTSILGEIGLSVFPFHHYEQALFMEGELAFKEGNRSGERMQISGWGNRDHSWGWRDDFQFRFHHWVCASFEDRFLQGSVMLETSFPATKHGGFLSSVAGNVPVRVVDISDTYWSEPQKELGLLDRDVRYGLTTVDGQKATLVAHISQDYGRLYLNARSKDRSKIYQDCQIFCDYTLEETNQRGAGVLEVGKYLEGPGIADHVGKR